MIGQTALRKTFETKWNEQTLPHTILLVGPKGSGKKTLLRKLFDGIYLENNKIESVRKMIELANKVSSRVFILPDIDTMSISGKQALLKVIEDCPNNNYFIMTITDKSNVTGTIRSRSVIYKMSVYTPDEISQYIADNFPADEKKIKFITTVAETPGEVNELWSYDIDAFQQFAMSVFDSIEKASGANVFKIATKLSTKEDDGKWDIALFLKVFSNLCLHAVTSTEGEINSEDLIKYGRGCTITSKYIQQTRLATVNKQFLIDSWILEIRRAWM